MPRGLRVAAVLCLILTALTGVSAAIEATGLAHIAETKEASAARPGVFGNPEVNRRVLEAQFSALEPLRESRVVVLGALSVTCAFAFVASGRMLRPNGLSREGVRRMLGGTALAAAVLRTLDGAQWTVVVQRMGSTLAEAMTSLPEFQAADAAAAEQVRSLLPTVLFTSSVLQTALMAGAFALLGQYFRSERVRAAVTALDGPLDAE